MFTRIHSQSTGTPKAALRGFSRMMAGAARAVLSLGRALAHRRDVQLLLDLDERALKDIGLVRNDILGALAEPLIKDPSTILLVRSVERRARLRALDLSVRSGEREAPRTRPVVQRHPV